MIELLPTQTPEQAMVNIQKLPIDKQQSIFDYIDFLLQHQNKNPSKTQNRQFGLYQGKGSFKIGDDWEISEEEFFGNFR